jgi:protein-S-isoprenylcysteine O-methyltransferase Ste14
MLLRSTGALVSTVVHLSLVDLFIRREEKLLEKEFGDRWIS